MKKENIGSSFDSFLEEQCIKAEVEYRRRYRCRQHKLNKLIDTVVVIITLCVLLCALAGAFFSPHWPVTIIWLFSALVVTWILNLTLDTISQ